MNSTKKVRVRIVGDGTMRNTKIIDAETGDPVAHVQRYSVTHDVNNVAQAVIEIAKPSVDLECDAVISVADGDRADDAIEAEIQAKGLAAPRITPEDIEDAIREEHYFTGGAALDAVRFHWLIEDHRNPHERQAARDVAERIGGLGEGGARLAVDVAMGRDGNGFNQQALGLLTFCVLVLRNGFTVTGESACASPENFDVVIGRKIARENAVAKVWPLMGYELKCRLAREAAELEGGSE